MTKETLTTLKKPAVEDSTSSKNQKDEFSDEYALFKVSGISIIVTLLTITYLVEFMGEFKLNT